MASQQRGTSAPVGATARRRRGPAWSRAPWWLQVLVVGVTARAVSAVVLVAVARTQAANPWTPAAPSYAQYVGLMWDASWYRSVAEVGYPPDLPTDAAGVVQQNAWAFFPLFPLLVRPLLAVGLPWHVAAPLLATVLGLAALLVVHRVMTLVPGPRALPLVTVAVLAWYPAAPVLQVAYTESLALLLVAACLWALLSRRYGLMVPLLLALGLTRAVALPMAVVVLVHAAVRARAARTGERWPARERATLALAGLTAVVAGLLWPVLVGVLTGRPDAYAATQAAWRGTGAVVPLRPWLDIARWLAGDAAVWLLLGAAVVVGAVLASRALRRLGAELWAWTAGYLAYLVLVLEPGTSLVRFGLVAFPLAGALGSVVLRAWSPRARGAALAAVLVAGLIGQVAWLALLWRLVPPSGWPP